MVNCPISLSDANAAEYSFFKDWVSLQTNTIQSKPHQFQSTHINNPRDIMEKYQSITLCDNFMFVKSIPFFVIISHHIKFILALMTKDHSIKPVIENIK